VSEAAPAKVNLALHVTGRRPDGYHLIQTLAVFTALGDRIAVEEASADVFHLSGLHSHSLSANGDNLVIRARDLLREIAGAPCPPVAIALEKNLPVASGLGGGSSDAAATLKALMRHWRLSIPEKRLAEAALSLGADLPMCLAARPLLASGIGERLTPLPLLPAFDMVLVNPGVEVATPKVFSALESRDGSPLPQVPATGELTPWLDWLSATRNDLEPAAIRIAPAISETLEALRAAGAAFARMSGSGATCFGLFEDAAAAQKAAEAIRAPRPGWFVAATHTRPSARETP
jgi:4-diphosphocytidyl-2-C-methyl-D-erythritol kinase